MSKSNIEHVTKLDAAHREINAAIRMYFNQEDPIAVHAVVAGGMQIITDLGAKKGMKLGIEAGLKYIRPEKQKAFRNMMREPQNHIKHADNEGDEDKILEYRPDAIEFYLYFASSGFQEYTGNDTPESRVFMWWFVACNPDLLLEKSYREQIDAMIKVYGDFTSEDRGMMMRLISRLRKEKDLSGIDYRF